MDGIGKNRMGRPCIWGEIRDREKEKQEQGVCGRSAHANEVKPGFSAQGPAMNCHRREV